MHCIKLGRAIQQGARGVRTQEREQKAIKESERRLYLQLYNIIVSTFVAKFNIVFSKRTRDLKSLPRATLQNNRSLVAMSDETASTDLNVQILPMKYSRTFY
jgi:hypothetical protein